MAKVDVEKLIFRELGRKGEVRVADIVRASGFSRAYVNRFFHTLKEGEKIALVGKANQARYVSAKDARRAKKNILSTRRILKNINLSEDVVLDEIRRDTGIFIDLAKNVSDILNYAFTEMLNNAIEHSASKEIIVVMNRGKNAASFEVVDFGIGIFRNIKHKRGLRDEMEAIQDLLKGKQTTAPEEHTGEGIFFTSKVADNLTIHGSEKKLIFDNVLGDVFVKNARMIKGTAVSFEIDQNSKRVLSDVFREYTGDVFEFGKTKVRIDLYAMDNAFISRSQARRVLSGLDKFKEIVLDCKGVETVGQAFADEVFRVWQNHHKNIRIGVLNINENIGFMIERAKERRAESKIT